jgi:hypothetical protein
MVNVSERAAAVLFETLQASGAGSEQGMKLVPTEGGIRLQVSEPDEADRVIRYNEAVVLIVPEEVDEALGDALIDVQDSQDGPRLTIVTRGPGTDS